jgi:hypothetical protein
LGVFDNIRNPNINLFVLPVWSGQNIAPAGTETATDIKTEGFENIRVYHDADRTTTITVHASLDGTTKHGEISSSADAPAGPGSFTADVRGVPYVIVDVTNGDGINAAIVDLTIGMG